MNFKRASICQRGMVLVEPIDSLAKVQLLDLELRYATLTCRNEESFASKYKSGKIQIVSAIFRSLL